METYKALYHMADIVLILTIVRYFWQVKSDASVPNPACFFIWATSLPVNAITFLVMTGWDVKKSAVPMLAAVGIASIFFYSWRHHKFSKLQVIDMVAVSLTGVLFASWLTVGGAELFNLLIQISVMMGYWPVVAGLIWGKGKEGALAWLLGTSVYAMQIAAMTTSPDGTTWAELIFPFLSGIVGNGSVVAAIYWKEWKQK